MELRLSALALAAFAALSLTSCSSSGGTTFDSGQEVADAIGCADWRDDSDELFVTDGGSCSLEDGSTVGVYYFADAEARDSWVSMAADFGGLALVGDSWVISSDDRAVLQRLRAEHGGELSG